LVILWYALGEAELLLVAYQTVTPAPGFQVEVGKQGPPEVEVEFESESLKIEVHAAWRDGDLDVEVSESSED
jgi:hypothetical protein